MNFFRLDLGLVGSLAEEWEDYQKALCHAGIQLRNNCDELCWVGGDSSGRISAKNIYLALAKTFWPNPVEGWRKHLWKWDLTPKIKLFIWLSLENRILTWDNLQRKGWEGPNICVLCQDEAESVYHLFVTCRFSREVWNQLYSVLSIHSYWEGV
jgi:hypothetical protein